jgi:peptide/nickel transport system substrate-binding protein
MRLCSLARSLTFAAAATVLFSAIPDAAAQKSKDTLRVAATEPFKFVDGYYFPTPEGRFVTDEVYDSLIGYDVRKRAFTPALAKSWKRIDDTTLEFELRDDVKFHNGNTFGPDDVVYIANWLLDPNTKLPFPSRFRFLKSVEKTGPNTVRFTSKQIYALDLAFISLNMWILDSSIHKTLEDKQLYGRRSPVGTGSMKLQSFSADGNVVIERNDAYNIGEKQSIKTLRMMPIPEAQTQIAQLLTDGVDVIRAPQPDQLKELMANPKFKTLATPELTMASFTLDSINRSGEAEFLKDARVRRAVAMAIDRKGLVKEFMVQGATADDGLCFRQQIGCDYTVNAPAYDPEGAKKLLAEAGWKDGFPLKIFTRPPMTDVTIAVAGMLRQVGIKAEVADMPLSVYRKMRDEGKVVARIGESPYGDVPDAGTILDRWFGVELRDYWRDQDINKWMAITESTHDTQKRTDAFRNIFNKINEQSYIIPITSVPISWVFQNSIVAREDRPTIGLTMRDFSWAK